MTPRRLRQLPLQYKTQWPSSLSHGITASKFESASSPSTLRFKQLWVSRTLWAAFILPKLRHLPVPRPLPSHFQFFDRSKWCPTWKIRRGNKEQVSIDLIWDLLHRNEIIPDIITAWSGINSVAVLKKLVISFYTDARSMPSGFAYLLLKDLSYMAITHVWIVVLDIFPLQTSKSTPKHGLTSSNCPLYNGWKHPRSSRQQIRCLDAIKRNIEDLNTYDEIVPDDPVTKKDNGEKKSVEKSL